MQLVPILDIQHGKCVHTEHKNDFVDEVISEDPLETVDNWVNKGITRIHFVDVDAIQSGEPHNVDLLTTIKKKHPNVIIQVIGGIDSLDSAFIWIDAGADYLVLNGRAIRNKSFISEVCIEFPNKIIAEIGCRNGMVSAGSKESNISVEVLAHRLEEDGVSGLLITEMSSEDRGSSLNVLSANKLSSRDFSLFANGGIDSLSELKSILDNKIDSLTGLLLGKIVHQKDFSFEQAQQLLDS